MDISQGIPLGEETAHRPEDQALLEGILDALSGALPGCWIALAIGAPPSGDLTPPPPLQPGLHMTTNLGAANAKALFQTAAHAVELENQYPKEGGHEG